MKKSWNLREIRKKAGLTLEEVALKSGIPYSTIRALEIGLGVNFSFDIKQKVASALGVELFKLFPEEQQKFNLMKQAQNLSIKKIQITNLK